MPGSIKDLGNGKYQLTVSNGTGVGNKRIRHYKTIEAKNDADANNQLVLFSDAVSKGTIKNDGKMTVESYSKVWLKEYVDGKRAKKTAAEYKRLLKRINKAIGHIRLSKLKAHHLTQFYNMLREDGIREDGKEGRLSENTISHYHRLLSVMLETARIESDLITENPAKKIKSPPQPESKDITFYDEEETIALLKALEDPSVLLKYKVALNLIVFTGFRRGEVLGLEWKDIDFEKCEISVERTSQYDEDEGIYTGDPKTTKSVRTVTVPQEVVDLLKQYKVWQNGRKLHYGTKWVKEWDEGKRLFTQIYGQPMHPSTLNHWMTEFFDNNGLKKISPHGLRHTYATLLIGNGVNIANVSEDMGHVKKSTTLDIYTGAMKKKSKASSDMLQKTLFKKPKDDSNEVKKV